MAEYRLAPQARHDMEAVVLVDYMVYYRETSYGSEVIRILHDRMLVTQHF